VYIVLRVDFLGCNRDSNKEKRKEKTGRNEATNAQLLDMSMGYLEKYL
jgi:hypothetical protein